MRLSTTRLFPLLLMGALALTTFYLERTVHDEQAPSPLRRHDPDYLVTNFTATTYNNTGQAESVLAAARMIHYPDDDSTELIEPRLVQTKPNESRMSVRAERGALSRDGQEIFLYDHVLLTRAALGERPEARLKTAFLHVVRDRSLALTDREVHIEEDSRSIAGRGMEYNYDSGQLLLREHVRGHFEPKKAP
ncbi:MAG: LPS export ABC transporter periplasmic protein LptC [Clostridia bacterium]